MTTRGYTALIPGGVISLVGYGHDEPSRRANAICSFRELWPDQQLIKLVAQQDW